MPASHPPDPEPLHWKPRPTFRERALGAVGTPKLVGAVLFVAAVTAAIVIVLVQPHGAPASAESADPFSADSSSTESGGLGGGSDGGSAPDGSDEAVGTVFAHVVGEVASPGVVELEAGARVGDAVAAAGGATERAVLDGVNLARVVADGEQIVVPDAEAAAQGSVGGTDEAVDGSGGGTGGAIDLNTAGAAELETLPRVGPALAQRIVEWRQRNGRFSSVDQLLDVSGIGQKTLDGFRDRVRV